MKRHVHFSARTPLSCKAPAYLPHLAQGLRTLILVIIIIIIIIITIILIILIILIIRLLLLVLTILMIAKSVLGITLVGWCFSSNINCPQLAPAPSRKIPSPSKLLPNTDTTLSDPPTYSSNSTHLWHIGPLPDSSLSNIRSLILPCSGRAMHATSSSPISLVNLVQICRVFDRLPFGHFCDQGR